MNLEVDGAGAIGADLLPLTGCYTEIRAKILDEIHRGSDCASVKDRLIVVHGEHFPGFPFLFSRSWIV